MIAAGALQPILSHHKLQLLYGPEARIIFPDTS